MIRPIFETDREYSDWAEEKSNQKILDDYFGEDAYLEIGRMDENNGKEI